MASLRALAVALICIWLPAASAFAETWRVSALEWPPYASQRLKNGGLAVAALRKALGKIGVTLEIDYMSFPRAQALAKNGRYMAYFPAWPEEILDGFIASRPVMMSQVGVVYRLGTEMTWHSIHDLFLKYRVGYVRSFGYPDGIRREIDKQAHRVTGVDDETDLVRMLAANRIDAALTDPNVILHVAGEMNIPGLAAYKYVLFRKPLVLGFSNDPDNDARRTRLDAALPYLSRNQLICCSFMPLKLSSEP